MRGGDDEGANAAIERTNEPRDRAEIRHRLPPRLVGENEMVRGVRLRPWRQPADQQ